MNWQDVRRRTLGVAEIYRWLMTTVWSEPDFESNEPAFYYVRVLEIPTPRWLVYDKIRMGAEIPEEAELIGQERAYSSLTAYCDEWDLFPVC